MCTCDPLYGILCDDHREQRERINLALRVVPSPEQAQFRALRAAGVPPRAAFRRVLAERATS